jgi:hypothetical protein
VKRIQSVPLVIGQFLEAVDQNTGIVGSTTGMLETRMHRELGQMVFVPPFRTGWQPAGCMWPIIPFVS